MTSERKAELRNEIMKARENHRDSVEFFEEERAFVMSFIRDEWAKEKLPQRG